MFPRRTRDLLPEVSEKTGFSEEECAHVTDLFFRRFIPNKIRSLEEPFFIIKNLGDYRISPYEALTTMKRLKSMLAKREQRIEEGHVSWMKEYKVEEYKQIIERLTNCLSIITKIYGHEYMEEKFGEKYLEQQIPDYGISKEQLVQKRACRGDL